MSNSLRTYISEREPKEDRPYNSKRVRKLSVTAMVGPEPKSGSTRGVQILLENERFQLTKEQARDLGETLLRRVDEDDPVESTNWLGDWGTMLPNGDLRK